MREFRPEGWQKQARRLGDNLYDRLVNGDWEADEKHITSFFAFGYAFNMCKQRRKYVERRAAKRVHRLIRKGN